MFRRINPIRQYNICHNDIRLYNLYRFRVIDRCTSLHGLWILHHVLGDVPEIDNTGIVHFVRAWSLLNKAKIEL